MFSNPCTAPGRSSRIGSKVSCEPVVVPRPVVSALPVDTDTESLTANPSLHDSEVVRPVDELVEVAVPDDEPSVACVPVDCAAWAPALCPCDNPTVGYGMRPFPGIICTELAVPLAVPAIVAFAT